MAKKFAAATETGSALGAKERGPLACWPGAQFVVARLAGAAAEGARPVGAVAEDRRRGPWLRDGDAARLYSFRSLAAGAPRPKAQEKPGTTALKVSLALGLRSDKQRLVSASVSRGI